MVLFDEAIATCDLQYAKYAWMSCQIFQRCREHQADPFKSLSDSSLSSLSTALAQSVQYAKASLPADACAEAR